MSGGGTEIRACRRSCCFQRGVLTFFFKCSNSVLTCGALFSQKAMCFTLRI